MSEEVGQAIFFSRKSTSYISNYFSEAKLLANRPPKKHISGKKEKPIVKGRFLIM